MLLNCFQEHTGVFPQTLNFKIHIFKDKLIREKITTTVLMNCLFQMAPWGQNSVLN